MSKGEMTLTLFVCSMFSPWVGICRATTLECANEIDGRSSRVRMYLYIRRCHRQLRAEPIPLTAHSALSLYQMFRFFLWYHSEGRSVLGKQFKGFKLFRESRDTAIIPIPL